MNIQNLLNDYVNYIQRINEETLSDITLKKISGDKIAKMASNTYYISNLILKIINDVKIELTSEPLTSGFLLIGDKLLINNTELNITQNDFNSYIHSQMGYILSGRWTRVNKPSNADKNNAILWVGRWGFQNANISYSDESLSKLCTRKSNLKVKISVPNESEKMIIFNNMINSKSLPIFKCENNMYEYITAHMDFEFNFYFRTQRGMLKNKPGILHSDSEYYGKSEIAITYIK